jgi:hypothetical protein
MNQDVIAQSVAAVMPLALSTGLFVSLCTIQRPDGVLIDAGQPSGNFVNVAGLVNIPCMAPPEANVRITASEVKSEQNIQSFSELHVLLNGWYPSIEDGVAMGWRAVIDGSAFDLMGAESDSQGTQTRMVARFSGL